MHEFVEEGPCHQLLAELLTERSHRCNRCTRGEIVRLNLRVRSGKG